MTSPPDLSAGSRDEPERCSSDTIDRTSPTRSEHYIHTAQPELVIEAIDAVVEAVRSGKTRLGPGEIASTGASSWILVAIASLLVGLGLMLNSVGRPAVKESVVRATSAASRHR